jgi:hypothetical protein
VHEGEERVYIVGLEQNRDLAEIVGGAPEQCVRISRDKDGFEIGAITAEAINQINAVAPRDITTWRKYSDYKL